MRKERKGWCFHAVLWTAVVLLMAGTCAMAQTLKSRGFGYDAKSEVTVSGIVQTVSQATSKQSFMGTHLLLDTDGLTTDVQLGSQHLLKSAGITFAAGDSVKVTGAMTSFHGRSVLLARTITRGDQTLVVRNAAGFPVQFAGGSRSRAAAAKSKESF